MKSAKVPHVLADNGLDAVETRSTFGRQQNHPPWRAKNGNDWASQSRDPQRPDSDRLTDRHGQRTVPGLLLTMVGSTVLGTTLLVRGSAPRLPALLLALAIPLAWLILQATSLGNAALPIMFAFGILGRRLASGSAVADLPAAEAPAR